MPLSKAVVLFFLPIAELDLWPQGEVKQTEESSRKSVSFNCFKSPVCPTAALFCANKLIRERRIKKKKHLKLNIVFRAASGIAPTHRRISRTTRTGSKRRSTCCFAVRPSRQRSEASEQVEVLGISINIIFLSVTCVQKLLWEVFDKVFKNVFPHGGALYLWGLYCNVWLNKDFFSITKVLFSLIVSCTPHFSCSFLPFFSLSLSYIYVIFSLPFSCLFVSIFFLFSLEHFGFDSKCFNMRIYFAAVHMGTSSFLGRKFNPIYSVLPLFSFFSIHLVSHLFTYFYFPIVT